MSNRNLMKETPPVFKFFCGLVIMFGFVLQENLYVRLVQVIVFTLISIFSGRQYKPLPVLIMLLTVTLLNVLSPNGKILFSLGNFTVTSGALERGFFKGLLLAGLIVISRSFISSRLILPGRWGRLLGETFWYFELLTENRGIFNPRNPIRSVDKMLLMLSSKDVGLPKKLIADNHSLDRKSRNYIDTLLPLLLVLGNSALLLPLGVGG
ncbi:MAG: hypothetical protein JEY99_01640 [Spirochaetales bacterium]|nr:hypothetical protein [Spirochaetales bacterium]